MTCPIAGCCSGGGDERRQIALEYDYLVLALGSVTDVSRFPGLLEHGLQTKTVGDIFHLRNHLLDVLERASIEQDSEERRRLLTFVVAGTGFAGVEIGAQANELVRGALRYFPSIAAREIRFVLLGTAPRLLPTLNEGLAQRAARHLERCGVELWLSGPFHNCLLGSGPLPYASEGGINPTGDCETQY